LVLGAEMVSLAYVLWSVKSVAKPLFFYVAFPGEVVPFFSDNLQTELSKREVIGFILGK
jgi:hypothetical protein